MGVKSVDDLRMESNETVAFGEDDVLLYYNKLIEVNCRNVKKVTVNYMSKVYMRCERIIDWKKLNAKQKQIERRSL